MDLSWGPSCLATDTDYEVYEGTIGNWTSHAPVVCSTGGLTTHTLTPLAVGSYYLVVPRKAFVEGSYGLDSNLVERPPSASACIQQSVAACP